MDSRKLNNPTQEEGERSTAFSYFRCSKQEPLPRAPGPHASETRGLERRRKCDGDDDGEPQRFQKRVGIALLTDGAKTEK